MRLVVAEHLMSSNGKTPRTFSHPIFAMRLLGISLNGIVLRVYEFATANFSINRL